MMTGHVYTKALQFERRAYTATDNVDLHQGFSWRFAGTLIIMVAVWLGIMLVLVGPPHKGTVTWYAAAPIATAIIGVMPSQAIPQCTNLTMWIILLVYITRGHTSVINGELATRREDKLRFWERLPLDKVHDYFVRDADLDPWSTKTAKKREFGAYRDRTIQSRTVIMGRKKEHA